MMLVGAVDAQARQQTQSQQSSCIARCFRTFRCQLWRHWRTLRHLLTQRSCPLVRWNGDRASSCYIVTTRDGS